MLDKLQQHIDKHNLLEYNDRLLLTVSGGKDSVCMLHLFAQLDYPLAIAHCNFSLRGVDSDEDENFVKGLATKYGLPFFSKRFATNKYAQEKGVSTQASAHFVSNILTNFANFLAPSPTTLLYKWLR